MDLRERVVAAMTEGELSRRQAADGFDVAITTAINRVDRCKQMGSVAPGKMGGCKPKQLAGLHAEWLRRRSVRNFVYGRAVRWIYGTAFVNRSPNRMAN